MDGRACEQREPPSCSLARACLCLPALVFTLGTSLAAQGETDTRLRTDGFVPLSLEPKGEVRVTYAADFEGLLFVWT